MPYHAQFAFYLDRCWFRKYVDSTMPTLAHEKDDHLSNTEQAGFALTIAAGTAVSRVLGFIRDLLIAWLLGPFSDVFLVAFRLPNFLRRMLAEGSLGMAQASVLVKEDGPRQESLARQIFSLTVTATLCLAVLLFLFAPLAIFALAPGMYLDVGRLGQSRAVYLLRVSLPYLPFCAASVTLGALLMARRRFSAPSWSPAVLNICMIVTPLAVLFFQPDAINDKEQLAFLLCLGLVIGGFLQALGLGVAVKSSGGQGNRPGLITSFFPSLAAGLTNLKARAAVAATPVTLLGASVHHIHILAATFMASFLPSGSISSLYFAERLLELPLGLAGAAVGMAALPKLAAGVRQGNQKELAYAVSTSVSFSNFFSLPAAAGLTALAYPLIRLLFGHTFDIDQTETMANALAAYSLGLPAMCASRPLLQTLAILEDRRSPVIAAMVSLGAMLALSSPALALEAPGVALALSAAAWVHLGCLILAMRFHGISLAPAARASLKYLAAGLALGVCIAALPALPDGALPLALAIAGIVGAALTAWFCLFIRLQSPEALALTELFHKKRPPAKTADGQKKE